MNESLKELAVRYFEGPIAPEEECELFGFLAASPENAALMREWERTCVAVLSVPPVARIIIETNDATAVHSFLLVSFLTQSIFFIALSSCYTICLSACSFKKSFCSCLTF